MLQIFSKKRFLKDLLEDFVDIHNHILPGIDDGAKNVKESLHLIKKLSELGVKQCVATPHIMQDLYPNTNTTIGNAYQHLQEHLTPELKKHILIKPAAEYMLDSHFETLINEDTLLSLKNTYILIEMSYFQPPINLELLVFKIVTKGYIPVLAHPERYSYYHKNVDYYHALKKMGCLFQLNLLSLSDHYGSSVKKTGAYLLEKNLIDFVGTDAHNATHIEKLSNIVLKKKNAEKVSLAIKNTNTTFSIN